MDRLLVRNLLTQVLQYCLPGPAHLLNTQVDAVQGALKSLGDRQERGTSFLLPMPQGHVSSQQGAGHLLFLLLFLLSQSTSVSAPESQHMLQDMIFVLVSGPAVEATLGEPEPTLDH